MKKVLLSTVLVLGCMAANAFAVDASSSWDEILKDYNLRAEFSGILFNAGVYKPVSGVCLEADGETLNGGTAQVCAKYQQFNTAGVGPANGRTPQCEQYENVELKKSIHQTMLQCFRWTTPTHQDSSRNYVNCADLRVVPVDIATNYNVDVYNQYPAGQSGPQRISYGSPLFRKSFSIPACAAE